MDYIFCFLLCFNTCCLIFSDDPQYLIVMQAFGHRVMTVSPRYDQYKDGWDASVLVEVNCDYHSIQV